MIEIGLASMIVGSAFCLLAAVGMVRFPDFYTRVHAASKAGVLGTGLILVGVAFTSGDLSVAVRVLVGLGFLVLTGPLAAHLLARSAHKSGTKPASITTIEDSKV